MDWSPQQDQALRDVAHWLRYGEEQVYYMAGYAGTGKTTLARHLAQGVDGLTLFGAYTGKAAHVLRQKGCDGATTIHSMIYRVKTASQAKIKELEQKILEVRAQLRAEQGPEGELRPSLFLRQLEEALMAEKAQSNREIFDLNTDSVVNDATLVVIDECSMVDGQMGEDLLSFGKKVLVLGDPAQLPPVMGGGFFTERRPNIVLTEVHRQARDNPIIELATRVRQQQTLEPGRYGSSTVHPAGTRLSPEEVLRADQVLVGKNVTRSATNARFRGLLVQAGELEESALPVPGDRLVCLRNNHDLGLLNGQLWRTDASASLGPERVFMTLSPLDTDGHPVDVEAHTHHFLGLGDRLDWWERKDAQEFDYGYALTCHKSQGSQWDHVLVFNEGYCFRQDKYKWLYTAITRAAERVDVVHM